MAVSSNRPALPVELAGDGRDLARERVGPGLRDGGAGRCRGEDRERGEREDAFSGAALDHG